MNISPKTFSMLPPPPDCCQICAAKHAENLPHDRDSLYYQFLFSANWKRSPTWADAMAHCDPEMRRTFSKHLREHGVSEEKIGNVDG